MRRTSASLSFVLVATVLVFGASACHRHKHAPPDLSATQEPDRVLFEKAVEDIKNRRHEVARLTLMTLINTYPDSDYLERAKLAVADSWFKEGSTSGLTHAEAEYKDFITFFPNSPHAAYAQYQAALARYRQLEKPDRDPTHARRAEKELQLLLRNFPESEYAADGARKLMEVQELLAEGEYRVGRFYYIKQSYGAAALRLEELAARYPNYSRRDDALWMAARSFEKMLLPNPERAARYYAGLIEEHPLSDRADDARERLEALGKPVPEPRPEVVARAEQEAALLAQNQRGLTGRFLGMFSGQPDASAARAKLGPPVLDTVERKPPPASPEELEAQRQILVERLAATNPNVSGNSNTAGGKESAGKKKSFWRKLVPFS